MLRIHSFFLAFILFSFVSVGKAQENPPPKPSDEKTIEQLQRKVDEQALILKRLEETLLRQSELLGRQQRQLESLQGRTDQEPAKSVAAAAAGDVPSEKDSPKAVPETQNVTSAKQEKSPDKSVETGFGKIKFDGLIQGWYVAGTGMNNTFKFRRTELKFTGQINKNVSWTLMVDPSKALGLSKSTTLINGIPVVTDVSVNQSSRILQDAYISLNYLKRATIDIGQFKIPLSLEGQESSAKLDTVERALFMSDRSRGGALGDIRDMGVKVSGQIGKESNYQIGLFNGIGEYQNLSDVDQSKAIIGRFVHRPNFIPGLQIGISGGVSPSNGAGVIRRDRIAGELLYVRDKLKIKSEIMGGHDGDTRRIGYYGHVSYRFLPKFEGVFRIDRFDPDRGREDNKSNIAETDYVTGFNYYITENHFKFQVNYIRKTFNGGIEPSKNVFLANIQTSW